MTANSSHNKAVAGCVAALLVVGAVVAAVVVLTDDDGGGSDDNRVTVAECEALGGSVVGESCYFLGASGGARTWAAGREACQDAMAADLAAIPTPTANAAVLSVGFDNATEAAAANGSLWFGLNDRAAEGSFAFSNPIFGFDNSYAPWAPSEPQSSTATAAGGEGDAEDCVALFPQADGAGLWADRACSEERPFMCELPRATPPVAPTSVTATAGGRSARVRWSAPEDDGGDDITSYEVVTSPADVGVTTVAAGTTTVVVTGLVEFTSYTFTVFAVNAVGASAASAPSNSVDALAVPPTAPSSLAATGGRASVAVTFEEPDDDGGTAVRAYVVYYRTGGGSGEASAEFAGSPPDLPLVVTGLVDGSEYTVSVAALSGVAEPGARSDEATATPSADVPDAPGGVVAQVRAGVDFGRALVNWTAPADEGDSAIERYRVTARPPASGGSVLTDGPAPLSAVVEGLQAGSNTTFVVQAVNADGTSAPSDPSAAVVPVARAPDAPTNATATAVAQGASVSFSPPAVDGGAPVTSYVVVPSTGGANATGESSPVVVFPLDAGVNVSFTVFAVNQEGVGAASDPTAEVVPFATAPDAPANVTAAGARRGATVSFGVANDGGSPLTEVRVTATPGGGVTVSAGAASPVSVTGLTEDVEYTFVVELVNAVGVSDPSAPSAAVAALPDVPGAPAAVTASPAAQAAVVSVTAPADDGGRPVIGYRVVASPGGSEVTANGTGPFTVPRLLNVSQPYSFEAFAFNEAGEGAGTVSAGTVTVNPNVPDAPAEPRAVGGDSSATVRWAAVSNDGGSPVLDFEVLEVDGNRTEAVDDANATEFEFGGLVNGEEYRFRVRARNALGFSAYSDETGSVIPAARVSARSGDDDNAIIFGVLGGVFVIATVVGMVVMRQRRMLCFKDGRQGTLAGAEFGSSITQAPNKLAEEEEEEASAAAGGAEEEFEADVEEARADDGGDGNEDD